MLSISRNVRLSVCPCVCLSVCLFTFEVPFNGLFPPSSRSQMLNIFRYSESLGKSNGKKWFNIWTFLFGSGLKSPRKFFLCADLALQNIVETTLPDGLETFGRRAYCLFGISLDVFEFLRFGWFFPFFKKIGFLVFLVHPETTLPDGLETSGRRAYRKFWHISRLFGVFAFRMIFPVFPKNRVLGILGPPSYGIGATIHIGHEMLCLPYAGFFAMYYTCITMY